MTPQAPAPREDGASGQINPRAFAQGTGLVFQTAGMILMLGSCCVGSFFGLVQKPNRMALQGDTPRTVLAAWREFEMHQKLAAISVFATTVGGLGALAAGIGLQSDRHGSARLAVWVSMPLAAYHVIYCAYVLVRGPWGLWMLALLGLTGVWCVMALLALVSAKRHAENPPPRGLDRVPAGFKLPSTAGERMSKEMKEKGGV